MSDVNIKYKGTSIATIDASGSKTLQTSGKYCEGDIVVEYTDPEKPTQAKSATPTETAQDITPDSGKVLSKVSVGAIPKTYVGSGVTKKAAATVAPSTSEQTVCASGVYTTGEQKVSAITPSIVGNLDASSFAAPIVAAIEGKGVTVPAGTLLDGMASLIESIEAGGGGNVATGTFTPANTQSDVTVEHGLGVVPSTIVVVPMPTGADDKKVQISFYIAKKDVGGIKISGNGSVGQDFENLYYKTFNARDIAQQWDSGANIYFTGGIVQAVDAQKFIAKRGFGTRTILWFAAV